MIGTSINLTGVVTASDDAIRATKFDWLSQAFVLTALSLGRISVAFLILRVSNTKWHFYFLHTINIILFLLHAALIIWIYTQCRPVARLWNSRVPGTCQDPKTQLNYTLFLAGEFS